MTVFVSRTMRIQRRRRRAQRIASVTVRSLSPRSLILARTALSRSPSSSGRINPLKMSQVRDALMRSIRLLEMCCLRFTGARELGFADSRKNATGCAHAAAHVAEQPRDLG